MPEQDNNVIKMQFAAIYSQQQKKESLKGIASKFSELHSCASPLRVPLSESVSLRVCVCVSE